VQTNHSGNYTVIVTNFGGSATSSVATLTVQTSPVILVQPTPANQGITVGSTATYSVTAIGMVPLSYHWQLNGTNLVDGTRNNGPSIRGSGTNVLNIGNAQTNNSGNYTVVVTNLAGSVTSSVVVLTVTNIPLAITVQPTNQTVALGSNATFAVSATGTGPLNYHWQFNGMNLVNQGHNGHVNGVNTTVLTVNNALTNNGGSYTVVVSNFQGSVTSSVAVLTVAVSPIIMGQPTPTNQSLAVGATATFAVSAVGIAPLNYQWQVNGTNLVNGSQTIGSTISGATNKVLIISNVQTADSSSNYTVMVANSAGSIVSSNAILTVTNIPPTITVQPTNQTVGVGSTVTNAVTATGTLPLSYQWLNGTNLVNDATNNLLIITNAQTTDSGNYTVIVTNFGGSVTSSVAILTVASSPVILLEPTNQTVGAGSTLTSVVKAVGMLPLSYQWQVNGTNLVDGGQINGAITNVLVISNAQANINGSYAVIVTNFAGSVTSSVAILTVAPLSFANIVATPGNGGGFILSGDGGTNSGAYYVLISSNLLLPLTNWTSIATNHFDSTGHFIFTNTAPTNAPQEFYLLQMP
jgi:hypothetical protein